MAVAEEDLPQQKRRLRLVGVGRWTKLCNIQERKTHKHKLSVCATSLACLCWNPVGRTVGNTSGGDQCLRLGMGVAQKMHRSVTTNNHLPDMFFRCDTKNVDAKKETALHDGVGSSVVFFK